MSKPTQAHKKQVEGAIQGLVDAFFEDFEFKNREQALQTLNILRAKFNEEFTDEIVKEYFELMGE